MTESSISFSEEVEGDSFIELYSQVIENALSERDGYIFDLRFGISTGTSMTLQSVANIVGVTCERIRQILSRCFQRIRAKIRVQKRNGAFDQPCARLAMLLESVVVPGTDDDLLRLAEFIEENLTYLPIRLATQLTANFVFDKAKCQQCEKEIRVIFHEKRRQKFLHFIQARENERLDNLFSFIMWPGKTKYFEATSDLPQQRAREVSEDGDGNNGTFLSQKMNREIQYESELEMNFLLRLEASNEIISYQEQPLALSFEDESGKKCQYYPDIFFMLQDKRGVYVEIKPVSMMALQKNLMKWRAIWLYCRDNGFGLLVTDGRWTYQQLRKYPVSSEKQKAVLTTLERNPVDWNKYKQLREKYEINRYEFQAIILQQKLNWNIRPFQITLPA